MNRKKLKILPNLPKMLFQRVVMVCISILAQVAVFALMIWRFKDAKRLVLLGTAAAEYRRNAVYYQQEYQSRL